MHFEKFVMIWLPVWNKIFIVVQVEILIQFIESLFLQVSSHSSQLCRVYFGLRYK